MNKKIALILILLLVCLSGVNAQKSDTTTFVYKLKKAFALPEPCVYVSAIEQTTNSITFSPIMVKDEYVSPNEYSGLGVSFNHFSITPLTYQDKDKMEPKGSIFASSPVLKYSRFIRLLENNIRAAIMNNKSKNRSSYFIDNDLRLSFLYNLFKTKGGDLYVGSGIDFNIGTVYNASNSNNPASMKLSSSLLGSALYSYRVPVETFPMQIILNGNVSLLGATFSPEFGESYYEIFSINNNVLKRIYFSNFKNTIKANLRLTLDIPVFDVFNMSIGGFCNYYNCNINKLNTEILSAGVSLGITRFMQSVKGRKMFNSDEYKTPL